MTGNRVHLRIEPGMRFGAPHIRGITAETIADMTAAGEHVEVILAEFDVTRPEVLTCCWFMAVYGTRLAGDPRWDQMWGPWLDEHHQALAGQRFDEVPDPPAFPPEEPVARPQQ